MEAARAIASGKCPPANRRLPKALPVDRPAASAYAANVVELKTIAMIGRMDCHGLTDIGKKREANEDQFLIADLSKTMRVHQTSIPATSELVLGDSQGKLLLVADGMGGAAAGEKASKIAVTTLTGYLLNTLRWYFRLEEGRREEDFREELKDALQVCQARIETDAEAHPKRQGMGTTLTFAYVIWPRVYVVHVGDSRCYLMRGAKLEQITRDHTWLQGMIEHGVVQPEDAKASQFGNVLWNVLGGGSSKLTPEVYKAELETGDTLLLCTDGLTRHVDNATLAETLRQGLPAAETCRRLVEAANQAGGEDNITVVVARCPLN